MGQGPPKSSFLVAPSLSLAPTGASRSRSRVHRRGVRKRGRANQPEGRECSSSPRGPQYLFTCVAV